MKTIKYVASATFNTLVGLAVLMGIWHLLSLAEADELYLSNLKKNATGTLSGGKYQLDVNASSVTTASSGSAFSNGQNGDLVLGVRKDSAGPLTGVADGDVSPFLFDSNGDLRVVGSFSEAATAADGGSLPALLKIVGGYDGTNTQVIKTDSAGELQIDVLSSALPSGAATSANQTTANTSLSNIDGKLPATIGQKAMAASLAVVVASDQSAIPASQSGTWNITNVSGTVSLPTGASTSALQTTGNTSLSNIDAGVPEALGQTTMAASMPVTIASDQSAVPASQSGTWNITNISGTVSLPTGAATSANQTTANTSLSNIDAGVPAALGQTTMSASMPVTLASDQTAVATKAPLSAGGAFQEDATVTTVAESFTATANSVEVICQAPSSNTANVRVKIGGSASSTSGFILEPGRDVTYHSSSNISYAAESGTQAFHCQFIAQ